MTEQDHKAVTVIERGLVPETMHPVVAAALQHNPDPETLRELLAVQREWEAGESRKAYTRALTELKSDLPTVLARDMKVAFGNTRYTHTSLAAVMDAITIPLTLHGFSLSWRPSTDQSMVTVACRLTHRAGHFEEAEITAPRDDKGSKSPAQAVASTITLLSRYTCLSLLGIATADHKEPQGETPPEHTDVARNMRALKGCIDAGHTKQEIEAEVGKPTAEWTAADLGNLRAWYKQHHAKAKEDPLPPPAEDYSKVGPKALTDEQVAAMESEREPGSMG